MPSIWIYSLHYFTLRNFFELLAQRRVKLFFETLETLFLFLLLIVYLKLSYSLLQRRAGDVGTYLHKSTYALLASLSLHLVTIFPDRSRKRYRDSSL